MTKLKISKDRLQEYIVEFTDEIGSEEIKIEFDESHFLIRKVEESSVLDLLISQAVDLGPEDLSINVDHYLYGLPKKGN